MSALKPWKVVVAFVLVFVAGISAGMVLAKVQAKRAFEQNMNPETWISETMEKLDREVKLTSEQKSKIRALVESGAKQVRGNIFQMATDSALLIDRIGDDIDKELTPEQRAIHGRMREEFRRRVKDALNLDFKRSPTNAPPTNAPLTKGAQ